MAVKRTNAGADLERRVARLDYADGALVRTRWPVIQQVNGRRRTVTDVDVLTIDFDARLRPLLAITECKSARSQSGEVDRLLWLAGLQRYIGADRAVLVRDAVSAGGREAARRLSLDLLGTRELDRRETDHRWVPEHFGKIGITPYVEAERRADGQLKKVGEFAPGLVSFLRDDALVAPPHRVLGAIVTLNDLLTRSTVVPDPLGTLLASDVLMALVVAAMRVGAQLDSLGMDGVRRSIEDGMASGDPNDRQVLKVVDIADRLLRDQLARIHRAYAEAGARPLEWSFPSLREAVSQPPPWLPRFFDLSERLRRRPSLARESLQTIDLACFDALLGGQSWTAPAFDHLFTVQHRQAVLVALELLQNVTPNLAERLNGIKGIPFERVAPMVPDYGGRPPTVQEKEEAHPSSPSQMALTERDEGGSASKES